MLSTRMARILHRPVRKAGAGNIDVDGQPRSVSTVACRGLSSVGALGAGRGRGG